jgi:hypothetical protein
MSQTCVDGISIGISKRAGSGNFTWHDPIPRNRIWGRDLLTKNEKGQPSVVLAILGHANRAYLRL